MIEVDPDLGAGLYLSEGQYGFVVDDVDEKPGQQPDAQVLKGLSLSHQKHPSGGSHLEMWSWK